MLNVDTNIEEFHIPLETIEFLHLSYEFEVYKPYDLKLNVTSGKFSRNIMDPTGRCEEVAVSSKEDEVEEKDRWFPGKTIVKVVKGTGSIVRNSVVDASNSVNSVANSVMSVMGVKAIQTKVIINFPNTREFETKTLEGRGPYWDETCHHRLELSDIMKSSTVAGFAEGESKAGHTQSPTQCETPWDPAVGIHMHLVGEGADRAQVVLGSQFVRYSELVPTTTIDMVLETSQAAQGGHASEELDQSFILDSDLSLHIRIVRGEGLIPPEKGVMSVEKILTDTTDTFMEGVNVMTNVVMLSQGLDTNKKGDTSFKVGKALLTNRKPCVVASFAKSDRSVPAEYTSFRYEPHTQCSLFDASSPACLCTTVSTFHSYIPILLFH
jgi:hypothetical protein